MQKSICLLAVLSLTSFSCRHARYDARAEAEEREEQEREEREEARQEAQRQAEEEAAAAQVEVDARPHFKRARPPHFAGHAEEGLAYCNSSIDCGSGQFCKDRGDGLKLCMGNNARGDYCESSIDCNPGMFCKE